MTNNTEEEDMCNTKTKVVSCVLVASLSFYIGCYSNQTTTKAELIASVELVDITVHTKESLEYKFLKENYRIQGDTLSGSGVKKPDGSFFPPERFDGSISFADITSVETVQFSVGKTILAIVLPITVLGIVFGIAFSGASKGIF